MQLEGAADAGPSIPAPVKMRRREIPKLDLERLLSPAGLPRLLERTKKTKWGGQSDLQKLMKLYQVWGQDLFPKLNTKDFLVRTEKVCTQLRARVYRDNQMFLREHVSIERRKTLGLYAEQEVTVDTAYNPWSYVQDSDDELDPVDKMAAKTLEMSRLALDLFPDTEFDDLHIPDDFVMSEEPAQSDGSITHKQISADVLEKIEQNRLKALASLELKRQERIANQENEKNRAREQEENRVANLINASGMFFD